MVNLTVAFQKDLLLVSESNTDAKTKGTAKIITYMQKHIVGVGVESYQTNVNSDQSGWQKLLFTG